MKRGLHEPVETVRRPAWVIRWVCGPFLLLIMVGTCAAYIDEWKKSGEFPARGILAVLAFTALYFGACWPGIWKTHKWAIFVGKSSSSPHDEREFQVCVSSSGIELDNGISRTVSSWECYTRAKFFDDGILLESGPSVFTWLPDESLVQFSRADAEAIVRSHVAPCFVMPVPKRSQWGRWRATGVER